MAFDDLVRKGVALADRLTGSLQASVSHQAWTGQSVTGTKTYAAAVSRPAIVDRRQRIRRAADGSAIMVTAEITFLRPIPPNGAVGRQEPVDSRDLLTLPDGSSDPIVDTEGLLDPDTGRGYYGIVRLGRAA